MSLDRLTIRGVRNLSPADLTPAPGVNWFYGPNGAGKTSVLEAIYLLGRGRSFRASRVANIIQHGSEQLQVAARQHQTGHWLGVERASQTWRGRLAGRDCQRISEFARMLPLVLIEPDSHRLVDGGPETRRRYLDWQLFHVEQSYLSAWQRYARMLRQRNAALKSRQGQASLAAFERPMAQAGEVLNTLRAAQTGALTTRVSELVTELGFRLPGSLELAYRQGHPPELSLEAALQAMRDSDRERGFTQRGPHRAELVLTCDGHPAARELSRGQQKLLAVALNLAQLRSVQAAGESIPLLLLDDPVSELDAGHLEALLAWLPDQPFQTWVTATSPPAAPFEVFHVEQGQINTVV